MNTPSPLKKFEIRACSRKSGTWHTITLLAKDKEKVKDYAWDMGFDKVQFL